MKENITKKFILLKINSCTDIKSLNKLKESINRNSLINNEIKRTIQESFIKKYIQLDNLDR